MDLPHSTKDYERENIGSTEIVMFSSPARYVSGECGGGMIGGGGSPIGGGTTGGDTGGSTTDGGTTGGNGGCFIGDLPIDDINVSGDRCVKCKNPKGSCVCCVNCQSYPCKCYPDSSCDFCNSHFCHGECQTVCFYCGSRGCDGRCYVPEKETPGGGGSGVKAVTVVKVMKTLSLKKVVMIKCPDCKKCLNPTKPNCVRCDCLKECGGDKCKNPGCRGCLAGIGGRPSIPLTRAALNHKMCACPPVCSCGETQRDTITGLSGCKQVFGELIYDSVEAYNKMWSWSTLNNKECAGHLLIDNSVLIYYNEENTYRSSSPGTIVTKCGVTNMYFSCTIDKEGNNEKILLYQIKTGVHTHPKEDVRFDKILNEEISVQDLAVSQKDIDFLINIELFSGIIISNNYIFEFYRNTNLMCKVIGKF